MSLHNLGTVIAFEVRRTLTKPTFWLATLSVPLLMGVIFGLSIYSNLVTADNQNTLASEPVTFTWSDASGIVDAEVATRLGGTEASDPVAAADAVREGRSDLHIDVPVDPSTEQVEVIGRDLGLIDSGRWAAVARQLVQQSAAARVGDPQIVAALGGVGVSSELWEDGRLSPGFSSAILPGLFLVLLFMSVVMLGNQMLNITVEEKENRVTEMILTTIHPSTLILGKVVGVVVAGLVQGATLLVPLLIYAWVQGSSLPPDATSAISSLLTPEVDAGRIAVAVALFVGSFLLFAGLLVAIGAIMPTAKDAGSAFGGVVIAFFLPLYAVGLIIGSPESTFSTVMTFFPLTAPVTTLLRNAMGTLPILDAAIALVIIYGSAAAALWLGVKLFREGSIAYDQRLKLAKVLRPSR